VEAPGIERGLDEATSRFLDVSTGRDSALAPDTTKKRGAAEEFGPTVGPIEVALAKALEAAANAGRFDVVAQLAKELEARRLARMPNVVALDAARRERT
jgi:hypothetical protein